MRLLEIEIMYRERHQKRIKVWVTIWWRDETTEDTTRLSDSMIESHLLCSFTFSDRTKQTTRKYLTHRTRLTTLWPPGLSLSLPNCCCKCKQEWFSTYVVLLARSTKLILTVKSLISNIHRLHLKCILTMIVDSILF